MRTKIVNNVNAVSEGDCVIVEDEIDGFILDSSEQKKRNMIWEQMHKSYLEERERKKKSKHIPIGSADHKNKLKHQKIDASQKAGKVLIILMLNI